ncbi:MAG: hypothetical protein ABI614_12625 [Planctomycetota bacterium]
MKRIALCFAVVAAVTASTNSVHASDLTEIVRVLFNANHRPNGYAAQQAHFQHHADLQGREIEREYVHQAAHQQPLTYGQHGQLHNALDQAAYQDVAEHDVAHATRAYAPRGYSNRAFVPGGYQAPYNQGYGGGLPGYGNGAQFGASQYQPAPFANRGGCSPYGRY